MRSLSKVLPILVLLLVMMVSFQYNSTEGYLTKENRIQHVNTPHTSDPPLIDWNMTYGGIANEWCADIIATTDGGYCLLGDTWSYGAGGVDLWLVKVSATGSLEWNQTYGGSQDDHAGALLQTRDGGYILAGLTGSYGHIGAGDIWLVKTDNMGITQWNRTFVGDGGSFASDIIQTEDGGYVPVGELRKLELSDPLSNSSPMVAHNDMWLVKTTEQGDHQWNYTYSHSDLAEDTALAIALSSDGGYILVGNTQPLYKEKLDILVVKTDADGMVTWIKSFGGNENENAFDVLQTIEGGYTLVGSTGSYGQGEEDIWLISLNKEGNMLWNATYGGPMEDVALSFIQTTDEAFTIIGYTESFGAGRQDIWVIRADKRGTLQWNQTIGGTMEDIGGGILALDNNEYIVAGHTRSFGQGMFDLWLVKLGKKQLPWYILPTNMLFGSILLFLLIGVGILLHINNKQKKVNN